MKKRLVLLLTALGCTTPVFAVVDPAALDAARTLFSSTGKSREAQAAYEKITAADPACAEAQRSLAELALRRDDADQALAYAGKAVALSPDNDDCQTTLGDACGRAAQKASIFRQPGLAKKCLAAYQRAAELAPAKVRSHQNLFEFYRQAPGFLGGGAAKALAEAATIKQLDVPQGCLAFVTLYAADKQYDLAFAEFDEALRASPDNYTALYYVGRLAATTGQHLDRGLASLRHCLELTPGKNDPPLAAAHWRIGNILEKKNDPVGARAAYEAALQADPKFAQAADALKKLR